MIKQQSYFEKRHNSQNTDVFTSTQTQTPDCSAWNQNFPLCFPKQNKSGSLHSSSKDTTNQPQTIQEILKGSVKSADPFNIFNEHSQNF